MKQQRQRHRRNLKTPTDRGRVELRLRPEDKATLARAAALNRLDLTAYILEIVLRKAEADIAAAERLPLSERDSLRVLALLENPPAAPARLVRSARFKPPLKKHTAGPNAKTIEAMQAARLGKTVKAGSPDKLLERLGDKRKPRPRSK